MSFFSYSEDVDGRRKPVESAETSVFLLGLFGCLLIGDVNKAAGLSTP